MTTFKCTCRSNIFKSSIKHADSVFVLEKKVSKSGRQKKSKQARSSDVAELEEIAKDFTTINCYSDDESSDWHTVTGDGNEWLWKSAALKTLRADALATREQRAIKKISENAHPEPDTDEPVHARSI
jgi:hypothetical protein